MCVLKFPIIQERSEAFLKKDRASLFSKICTIDITPGIKIPKTQPSKGIQLWKIVLEKLQLEYVIKRMK